MDLHEILEELSRTPVRTAYFTETLTAGFLEKPVISRGSLEFIAPSTMIKRITYPEVAEHRIVDDVLFINQGGEVKRTIPLASHPEISVRIYAIQWILSGNIVALKNNFDVIFSKTGNLWRIELAPDDSEFDSGITNIIVSGKDDRIRKFEIKQANGVVLSTELYENN